MGDLLNQITDFLGQIWDSPVVQLGLRAIAIYIVILWLAAAYWAFRDMQLRTSNPILPYFAASLVIIFTPVFFPFAIIAYRIIRPQEKIGEVYERTLAEEALLAEVEAVKSCPTCARRVNEDWIICPTCRTRLNRVCPNCSRLVGLDWSLCAWCGRDFERAVPDFEAIPAPRQAPEPAPEPTLATRPGAPARALSAPAYRNPDPAETSSYRASGIDDGTRFAAPGYREAAPQAIAGGSTTMAAGYDTPSGSARSLDRAPAPPSTTRPSADLGSARGPRASARGSTGATSATTGPRPSTDPLTER
jgi:RNA polymerase subunit RPABC4/transcription elongation factor Spt4